MKPRLLALLLMELKVVDNLYVESLIKDIEGADEQEQRQLVDWLVANVLMKKAALKKEVGNWLAAPSMIKQRVFWSLQARTIKVENQALNTLLAAVETQLADAPAMVQEHMNWCAAQIGIADENLRPRCIRLGETLGLYKDYPVSKGCTSPYLSLWIESVVGKRLEK